MRRKEAVYSVFFIIAIILFSLKTTNLSADSAKSLTGQRTFTETEIADYITKFKSKVAEEYHIPNLGMAIVYNGNQAYLDADGYEDIEKNTKCNPSLSRFGIASTTKLFTYISIMQLMEQGKIELNDNIFNYLDFEIDLKYDEPIRIIDLMNHRGGFEDSLYKLKADNFEMLIPLKEWLIDVPPSQIYQPGTYTAYSNYGVSLLGQVIASVSGMSYEDYLEENIFHILGMENTTSIQKITEHTVKLYEYSSKDSSFIFKKYEIWNERPAGSIQTTPEDMAKICIAMMNGGVYIGKRILSNETMNLMQENSWSAGKGLNGLAHGLIEGNYNGYKFLGHGGDNNYQHTSFCWFNDLGIGFYITGCGAEAPIANGKFMTDFIDAFYEDKTVLYTFANNIDLKKYTGSYYWARSNYTTYQKFDRVESNMKISPDGEWLLFGSSLKFKPVNETLFVSEDGKAKVFFYLNENGNVTGLNFYPVTDHIRQSTLESKTGQVLPLCLCLFFLAALGMTRFVKFIVRKLKKQDVDFVDVRAKKFSNMLIAYTCLIILIYAFVDILIDSDSLLKGHLFWIGCIAFLFLLYVPLTAIQIFRTIRLFIITKRKAVLKMVELLVCLTTSLLTLLLIYWNFAKIPYLF